MSAHSRKLRKTIDRGLRALDELRTELIASKRELVEAEDLEQEKTPVMTSASQSFRAAQAALKEPVR